MAQVAPEYEVIEEFAKIAKAVTDRFAMFMGLDTDTLICVGITNKDPSDDPTKGFWDIKPVPMPIRMKCPYDYFFICNMQDWVGMDREHKQVEVFNGLVRIPCGDPGKVLPPDVKDFRVVIKNFGLDYRRGAVPDILADDFHLNLD